jgi:hypothetical protein
VCSLIEVVIAPCYSTDYPLRVRAQQHTFFSRVQRATDDPIDGEMPATWAELCPLDTFVGNASERELMIIFLGAARSSAQVCHAAEAYMAAGGLGGSSTRRGGDCGGGWCYHCWR